LRETDGTLSAAVDIPFQPDLEALKESGFFDCIDAIYLADAATDEIIFRQNTIPSVPVASLSKLLSYLVLREGMDAGEISTSDMVRISDNAERLSNSGDGMIKLTAGEEEPFGELLEAMLIASSNESALALAEHLCGSEGAFVDRMNRRALELGLKSTRMYNCNGLPSYSEDSIPVKRQNRMSAEDLYRLIKIILERYPEITEITSIPLAHMPSLNDYRTANSNPLLFNMPGVNGLKTGSTNKAGYCIAATLPVQTEGEQHTLVLIILGAETADLRGQAAEILLRYALTRF
jgi:D-alanyl-D-alanine carboxypeptidase